MGGHDQKTHFDLPVLAGAQAHSELVVRMFASGTAIINDLGGVQYWKMSQVLERMRCTRKTRDRHILKPMGFISFGVSARQQESQWQGRN